VSEHINKFAARQAFNDAVEMTARLAAFTTSRTRPIFGRTNISRYAKELAHRDLVLLGISTRRVVELANLQTLAETEDVQLYLPGEITNFMTKRIKVESGRHKMSLWHLVGIIVHHLDFAFYTTDAELNLTFNNLQLDEYQRYQLLVAGTSIDAQCSIKSDKSSLMLFDVSNFLKSVTKVIEAAEHEFSDLEIYVGNYSSDD
jgi:hypothetical protein